MAFQIGSIFATLGMDTSGYTRGILNAQSLNAAFGQSVTNFVANPIAGAVSAFRGFATTVARWGSELLQQAQNVQRLNEQTGISTDLLQTMAKAIEANGGKSEQASQGLRKLVAQIGMAKTEGGPAADAIAALGLNLGRLGDNDTATRSILEALAAIEDPARRSAIAAKLLGEEAGPVLANQVRIAGGSVQALISDIRGLGQIIESDAIAKLERLKIAGGRLDQLFDGLKTQSLTAFLSGFAGEFDSSTKSVEELVEVFRRDLIPLLESAGKYSGAIVRNFDQVADALTVIKNSGESAVLLMSGPQGAAFAAQDSAEANAAYERMIARSVEWGFETRRRSRRAAR